MQKSNAPNNLDGNGLDSMRRGSSFFHFTIILDIRKSIFLDEFMGGSSVPMCKNVWATCSTYFLVNRALIGLPLAASLPSGTHWEKTCRISILSLEASRKGLRPISVVKMIHCSQTELAAWAQLK